MICKECMFGTSNQEMIDLGASVMLDDEEKKELMFCRRYPPQSFIVAQGVIQITPAVKEKGWCGEWRAKLQSLN